MSRFPTFETIRRDVYRFPTFETIRQGVYQLPTFETIRLDALRRWTRNNEHKQEEEE